MSRLLPLLLPARPYLRLGIGSLTASDHYGAEGTPDRNRGGRLPACRRRLTGEKVTGAREAETRRIDDVLRESVILLKAEDLFAKSDEVCAVGVETVAVLL